MLLSHISDVVSIDVQRDGEFHSLGYLSHNAEMILVGLYDPDYLDELVTNNCITCVVTSPDLAERLPEPLAIAVCDDPKAAFYQIHTYLSEKTDFYWQDFDSEISPQATIHERAYVAPKNVRIGAGTIIEPNVSILERSILGEDVIIRAGSVIGGEGLEVKFMGGRPVKIPHAGGVMLHHRVEIQGNVHVQRSVYSAFTELGEDTMVGPLVSISHSVQIGRRAQIRAGAQICGSARIGDDVWIGPNATISNGVRIGHRAFVALGAVVTRDVPVGHRAIDKFVTTSLKMGPPANLRKTQGMRKDQLGQLEKHIRSVILRRSQGALSSAEETDTETCILGKGLGLDSMEMVALVTEIEAEFGIMFDDDELTVNLFESIGTLTKHVHDKLTMNG